MKKSKRKARKYSHLVATQRDRIEALIDAGEKQKEIAKILRIDPSTVCREIRRNRRRRRVRGGKKFGKYEAEVANHKAIKRRENSKYRAKKINENQELKKYIVSKLKIRWSPDEISGRMKREKKKFYASKTAIYEWLWSSYGQRYCKYLYSRRYHPKKRGKKHKKVVIPHRIGLEKRPKGATNRTRYGHHESDTFVSGKKTGSKRAGSVTFERKAKYVSITKIKSLSPIYHTASLKKKSEELKIKSFSMDNGIENAKYEEIGIPTYFCEPYSSWQKGGVEGVIKLIRWHIPKGVDIDEYSDDGILLIENTLNNKPRKSLRYKTPYEVMVEHNLFIGNKKTEVALRG